MTVSFACHLSETALCLIPMFLTLGFAVDSNSFWAYCRDMFSVYAIALLIVNGLLLVLGLILSIFQKQSFTLGVDYILIESKGESSTVNYSDVNTVLFDLGKTGRMSSRPMELILLGDKNKELLSITNPSLLMTHMIKKKCPGAKRTYQNSKKFVWYLILSVVIGIFTVVKSRFL